MLRVNNTSLRGPDVQNCALMVSVAFGFAVWGVSSLVYKNQSDAADMSAPLLGAAAGFVALLVVAFFSGLLIDVSWLHLELQYYLVL